MRKVRLYFLGGHTVWMPEVTSESWIDCDKAKKKQLLCCPLPTDRKMRKKQGRFLFVLKMSDLGEEFAKFVFNGLKKHLYMRFDCIPPEFSPFRNFKKNIGKLNSLTVLKKKNFWPKFNM